MGAFDKRWWAVLALTLAMLASGPLAASSEHGEDADAAAVKTPYYVFISPILVPLVKNGRMLGNVFVHVQVEVDGGDDADVVTRAAPRLQGRFMQALNNVPKLTNSQGRLDVEAVKAILLPVARKYADGAPIRAIVITRVTDADR